MVAGPALRHTFSTLAPSCAWRRMNAICCSLNFDRFTACSPSRVRLRPRRARPFSIRGTDCGGRGRDQRHGSLHPASPQLSTQPMARGLSLAHDVSGLGSTRVVRFGFSVGRDRDEPDGIATGTQDADILGCAGTLAGTASFGLGGGGAAGNERAQLPPVESGAGAVTVGYGGCSVAFAPGLSPSPLVPFPDPRSSNRTCGFPASGFRTRSCLRARKGHGLPRETQEAVICAQPLFRVSHESPRPRLVLSTEPLA